MTTDMELESWKQEWRDQTEPLPELKRKIKRQNQRTVGAVMAVCVCLAFSAIAAWYSRSSFMAGMASGIAFAGSVLGSCTLWVRRGSWRPTAQTTMAYAELAHNRAIAKARTLHFSFYFLLTAAVLFAGFAAWNWKRVRVRDGVVIAGMVVESFYLRRSAVNKKLEIEATKKLIDDMTE